MTDPIDATSPEQDPELLAELERALEPYRGLLPPEMLAVFRETLEDALTTHPVGALLHARVREAVARDASATVAKAGAPEPGSQPGSQEARADAKPKRGGST